MTRWNRVDFLTLFIAEWFELLGKRIAVSAFAKRDQLGRDLLVTIGVSKSSFTSAGADTQIHRPADTLTWPTAHFDRNEMHGISMTGH
jgi:hypothetical protein